MAVTLRSFTEFGKLALQKTICGGICARAYCIFSACTMCRKESSRSLSHLLMSFLLSISLTNSQDCESEEMYFCLSIILATSFDFIRRTKNRKQAVFLRLISFILMLWPLSLRLIRFSFWTWPVTADAVRSVSSVGLFFFLLTPASAVGRHLSFARRCFFRISDVRELLASVASSCYQRFGPDRVARVTFVALRFTFHCSPHVYGRRRDAFPHRRLSGVTIQVV